MPVDDDADSVERGECDSTERFLALLMSNQRRVHAFILSLVPNRNDADDLLQESIVVMWRCASERSKGECAAKDSRAGW